VTDATGLVNARSPQERAGARRWLIGDVARRAGTTPRTIRYYEEIGLLPADEGRIPGTARRYGEQTVRRLRLLKELRELLGLSLEQLRDWVAAAEQEADLERVLRDTDDPERRRELLATTRELVESQRELVRQRLEAVMELDRKVSAQSEEIARLQRASNDP
jgi:MerR family transcriptional regulator, repressor of the yfmOP operon